MISRLANLILYAVILAVIGALIYYYTDWFKPAAQKAGVVAKSVVESIPIGPFGKKEESGDALNQAREAYAKGDTETAIRGYSDFVKKNPTSVDAQGELGNVYYMTGRLQEAAQAFYEAAKLMIDQKQVERAQALLAPIGQGNPALATELQQKLQQVAPQQQSQAPQVPEGQPGQMEGGQPGGQPPMDSGMAGGGNEPQGGGQAGMPPPQYGQEGQPAPQGMAHSY